MSIAALYTQTLATGLTLYEDWEITIDLKFPDETRSPNWKNVFGLQVDGTQDYATGSRIPSIFLKKDALYLFYTPGGTMQNFNQLGNQTHYFALIGLKTSHWTTLHTRQTKGVFEIIYNNKLVLTGINSSPKTWTNVNVIMGNTLGEKYQPAVGEYRNFEVKSYSSKGKIINPKCIRPFRSD